MKQLTQFIGIIFVVLGIYSCSPWYEAPDIGYLDYMPEETSVGANTFGCYVNGNLAAARSVYQQEGGEHVGGGREPICKWILEQEVGKRLHSGHVDI